MNYKRAGPRRASIHPDRREGHEKVMITQTDCCMGAMTSCLMQQLVCPKEHTSMTGT